MRFIIALLVAVVMYLLAQWLLPMLNIPANIIQVFSLLIAVLAAYVTYRSNTWHA